VRAEPLETAESGLPSGLADDMSRACRGIPDLDCAYLGWMREGDEDEGAAVHLELHLSYKTRRIRPSESIGEVTPDAEDFVTAVPALGEHATSVHISCSDTSTVDPRVQEVWLRVF
jgi:hypothetical protein